MRRRPRQLEIDNLHEEIIALRKDRQIAADKIIALTKQLKDAESKAFPVRWHHANNAPGRPYCLGDSETGIAVELYVDKAGNLVGVVATEDVNTVGGAGMVPYGLMVEEMEYLAG